MSNKRLFFDIINLESKNVKIKLYEPNKIKSIFKFRKNKYEYNSIITGQYANILKINNDITYLYYQIHTKEKINSWKDGGIGIAKFNNQKNIFERLYLDKFKYQNLKTNIILMEGLAMQNFITFLDNNPNKKGYKFKAVGGYHSTVETHKLCERCKNNFKSFKSYSSCWPKKPKYLFDDKVEHKCRANGLYIYQSNDGINWELFHNKPVLSSLNKCKDLEDGSGPHFDTMPTIFYDDNTKKYILYIRANIKLGCRHVLYSESINLINWSIPELIKINPKFEINNPIYGGDNLYYMGGYKYPGSNLYISFPSFFKNKILTVDGSKREYFDECTFIMVSKDRINWKRINKILKYANGKGHMTGPHILDFKSDNEKFYFYVQEKFLTNNNKLFLYTSRVDGLSSITNIPNIIGEFKIKVSKEIKMNYEIRQNGYIQINDIYINYGNEISKKFRFKSDILNFKIFNAEIFSITGCD